MPLIIFYQYLPSYLNNTSKRNLWEIKINDLSVNKLHENKSGKTTSRSSEDYNSVLIIIISSMAFVIVLLLIKIALHRKRPLTNGKFNKVLFIANVKNQCNKDELIICGLASQLSKLYEDIQVDCNLFHQTETDYMITDHLVSDNQLVVVCATPELNSDVILKKISTIHHVINQVNLCVNTQMCILYWQPEQSTNGDKFKEFFLPTQINEFVRFVTKNNYISDCCNFQELIDKYYRV